METITGVISDLFRMVSERFVLLINTPWESGSRLFWLYLCCGVLFAYGVYYVASKRSQSAPRTLGGFVSFLFPKSVWSHSSAWLDIRFFLVNHFTGKLLYAGLTGATMAVVFHWVTGGVSIVEVIKGSQMPGLMDLIVSVLYMFVVIAITDFTAFYIHYLQHKIPLLWEFHKVHHSPEVMHPISNFREHPFDNVVYALGIGAISGVVLGGASAYLGYLPNMPTVLGIPLLLFFFNIGGYHLRHSHVWLRWPGRWSMVFPSPAHHHVHHSCHPEHLDKNFAFMFPLWDVLFRTYHMPDDDKDVKFGIYGMETSEYTSIWRLYSIPFRNIYKRLRAGKSLTVNEDPRQEETPARLEP